MGFGRLDFFEQFALQSDDLFADTVCKFNGVQHFVLGNLLSESLDHDYFTIVCGNDHIQVAFLKLCVRGKGDEIPVDSSNSRCSDGTRKRQGTDKQCTGATIHC